MLVPRSVVFSPDSKKLLSGSWDKTIKIWDIDSNGTLITGPVLQGHTWEVWSVAMSPDGKFIASGSSDHTIRVWDGEELLS